MDTSWLVSALTPTFRRSQTDLIAIKENAISINLNSVVALKRKRLDSSKLPKAIFRGILMWCSRYGFNQLSRYFPCLVKESRCFFFASSRRQCSFKLSVPPYHYWVSSGFRTSIAVNYIEFSTGIESWHVKESILCRYICATPTFLHPFREFYYRSYVIFTCWDNFYGLITFLLISHRQMTLDIRNECNISYLHTSKTNFSFQ